MHKLKVCLKELRDAGKIRFVHRDWPLDEAHPHARLASHAAACYDDQGKFWEGKTEIYRRHGEWNFGSTREAYGIGPDKVITQKDWTAQPATPALVNSDLPTLSNVRILDPNVVSPTFIQQQQRQNFYGFPTQLAVDRYKIDGELRDFVVAVRELDPSRYLENQLREQFGFTGTPIRMSFRGREEDE